MWLTIYKTHKRSELIGRVAGWSEVYPPEDTCPRDKFEVKEWDGPPPALGDLEGSVLPDIDPTLTDPEYQNKLQQRRDFEDLESQVMAEIQWLSEIIPGIDTMTATEVRDVVKRLAKQNRQMIKAWRYVIRRLG